MVEGSLKSNDMNRFQRANGKANGKKSSGEEVFAPIEIQNLGTSIPCGQYLAFCRKAQIYFDGGFKRWTCLLDFDILSERFELIATLPLWFNLGTSKKARVTRRSKFLDAWSKANGAPPSRIDRLSPRVFLRRMCRVTVGDSNGQLPRSVVREILEWKTGRSQSSTLAGAEGSTQKQTQPADAVLH
jgi:hypothetical protein